MSATKTDSGFRITGKTAHGPVIFEVVVSAPVIAKSCEPGQFVIVRADETGERIPLTIADFDREKGTITLAIQVVGASSEKIAGFQVGESYLDLVGPLGKKSEIEKFGTVVTIGGGLGIAPVYPIQRALKDAGNRIISIIGARSSDLIFWEDRMKATSDELIVATDDGSRGEKGFVTEILKRIMASGTKVDRVIAIGPAVMMKAVAGVTRPANIPTIVSLNSIMVDGTGMCGGCRVEVGDKTMFTCVDGPEFEARDVNFDLLLSRLGTYREEEKTAREHCKCSKERK